MISVKLKFLDIHPFRITVAVLKEKDIHHMLPNSNGQRMTNGSSQLVEMTLASSNGKLRNDELNKLLF
jgi:hypothetical protein